MVLKGEAFFEMPTTLRNIGELSKTWHSRVLSFGVTMFFVSYCFYPMFPFK